MCAKRTFLISTVAALEKVGKSLFYRFLSASLKIRDNLKIFGMDRIDWRRHLNDNFRMRIFTKF